MTSSWRLTVIILSLVTAVWSQQTTNRKSVTPVDPCGNAGNQMEIGNCQDALAKKADASVADLYQQIQTAVEAQMFKSKGDMKSHEAVVLEKLKTTQLLWTVYRDAQCDAAEYQYDGGTLAPSMGLECRRVHAEERTKELHHIYDSYLSSK